MSWWSKYSLSQMEEMMDFLFQQSQGGGSSASLIHQVSVSLTDAGIKAIPTGRVVITGDPSTSDQVILPCDGEMYRELVEPYVANSTPQLTLMWRALSASYASDYIGSPTFLTTSIGQAVALAPFVCPVIGDGAGDFAGHIVAGFYAGGSLPFGRGLYMRDDDQDGGPDYTGGDAGNSAIISVRFRVFDRSQGKCLTTTESGWDESTRTFS